MGPPPPEIPEGWTTGPPDFIGIGVQKAGTTWWWRLLVEHPDVVGGKKETHHLRRLGWRPMFERDAQSYYRYFPRPAGAITGEWTPRYLTTPGVIDNIAALAPEAKLLVLLRDPVERYRSGVGEWQKRRERTGKRLNLWKARKDAHARSYYGFMLSHYVQRFGRERLLILQFEACKADPVAHYARTLEFLGLREFRPPAELIGTPRNVSQRRLSAKVLDEPPDLVDSLEDDVRLLQTLVPDLDLSLWPNFAHLAGTESPGDD
jgi:hypothetical protein